MPRMRLAFLRRLMTRRKTLVYFGHVPAEGAGSAIIVQRHLQRFAAEGWEIFLVADWGQDHAYCRAQGWQVTQLSHRRPWWPPFNADQPFSRWLRGWLWAGEVNAWLGGRKVHGVLTYLSAFSDTLSLAAVGFARRYHLPLATLVHDDARDFLKSEEEGRRAHRRREWIVRHSRPAWFASPELAACFGIAAEKAEVLPPIAEGATAALPATAVVESPLLIYAGNYWAPQLPTFAHLAAVARTAGGRFLAVVKENPADADFFRSHGIERRTPFPRNIEALDYFRENASALVVSYAPTSAEMPWTRTSFPSKLIEYCHLGVPIVIVSAADTAVAHWANSRNFPDIFAPDDTAGLAGYIGRLRDPAFRRERARLARTFADGEFDPAAIQRKLAVSFSAE
jgi:hypothetical protein